MARNRQPVSVTHPDIASEWHPTKNGELTPEDVVAGSHKRVWWKCPHGPDHEWQGQVTHRTHSGSGCQYCAGKKASVTNSLAALFPDIAAEWHLTKNGKLTPEGVPAGSNKRVWWKCPQGPDHEWARKVVSRTEGGSCCPSCASLASQFPEIAAQWHATKNGELMPERNLSTTMGHSTGLIREQCPVW